MLFRSYNRDSREAVYAWFGRWVQGKADAALFKVPADYKLLSVGGGNFNLATLTSGQIGATYLVVPLDVVAEQQGFNVLGYLKDGFPNYQLSVLAAKRAGIRTILLPELNKKDLKEIPRQHLEGLEILAVSRIEDVFRLALH